MMETRICLCPNICDRCAEGERRDGGLVVGKGLGKVVG